MFHIAICDDKPDQLADIVTYTNEYIKTNRFAAEIRQFSHPNELLAVCERERFHIYILDIVMPMMNGIEVGRDIRRLDREAQIIYVTTEPGFALDAFAANPINYLLKPLDRQRLFDTLALAFSRADSNEEATITVKTKDGLRILSLTSILCCEYVRHTARYTLMGNDVVETRTFKNSFSEHIAPLLADRRFLQPHAAFAVNMSRVEQLTKNFFVLRGGVSVPIAKSQYAVVRNTYMDYMLQKEVCR